MEPDPDYTGEGKCEDSPPFISEAMNVSVNNEIIHLDDGVSVSQLLDRLALPATEGIALAVNNEVVPAADWPGKRLTDNDHIIIINATQGG